MSHPVEELSTLSSKGQTTVPKSVRQALGLSEGDQIAFRVDETGVTLRRAEDARDDPAMAAFLAFLAKDIASHPAKLKTLSPATAKRIAKLTKGMVFDPDEPIEGDVDL
ncbi:MULTISPECIES: type II toxin-antitoxin system PrlF family antitoxin [Rhodopseudomonas]|uniref:AbrB family transcriptional regulator n=1 Tax=Rhodopseudomonas palustris TaxID=1076 RepID=A0A0D7EHS0_RHOPL|nr:MULTISPECIES: type II toxin-antitoxin system PrlF family antitoxin [Rhodopseudomonas]KIZ40191.1 AbrB family transcriptional regulator [Rhodopseudomonas palustris]MDF3811070.1 type II toxin-antitoxin system PrlF family antitoxin [Rhodopseudomonas sp. BAL398]WOK15541.1 type II toxin-antitoxin system PrlF family antitoxin [Rhodopseudomonas sp. BAL398]